MMGDRFDNEKRGIIPRIIEQIFAQIELQLHDNVHDYEIKLSYVEIYMEKVKDLLDPDNNNGNLKIREHKVDLSGKLRKQSMT